MTTQVKLAIAAALIALYVFSQRQPAPAPPQPVPSSFSLRGEFIGETAAADAAMLAGLCSEIADEIEWDGAQPEPFLKTGLAFDALRTRARIARLKGDSVGDRQPRVRDAVDQYLVGTVGTSGGPVDAQARAAWVSAYRAIAEACRDAVR